LVNGLTSQVAGEKLLKYKKKQSALLATKTALKQNLKAHLKECFGDESP